MILINDEEEKQEEERKPKNGRKVCGKPVIVMSRIVGYYSPVNSWNKGKAQEFKERKIFKPQVGDKKQ